MKILFCAAISCLTTVAWSQHCPPDIEWQQPFETTEDHIITMVETMSDGGYFLAVSEDESWGFIRTDAQGNVLWFRPNPYPRPSVILETEDGGILYGADYLVVRLDDIGQTVWEQRFTGFNGLFSPRAIQQTTTGGFIVIGEIMPNVVVAELDNAGNLLSQRLFSAFADYPKPLNIKFANGGGYVVGSYAGDYDLRLTRVDDAGNVLWDHTYGGIGYDFLRSIEVTSDGGFILGSSSYSSPGKQKESPFFGDGLFQPGDFILSGGDYWIVRLDGNGNKLWDRSFGGNLGDLLETVREMPDHGFVVVGGSYSPAGTGNKTSPAFGSLDGWVVRTDAAGNELWEQSYGTRSEEMIMDVKVASDGSLILAGNSLIKLQPERLSDCDHDGVIDSDDLCLDTPSGEPVDSHGCSIGQLVPCDGPWKGHGDYLRSYRQVAEEFLKDGLINKTQFADLLKRAAHSQCGNRPKQ